MATTTVTVPQISERQGWSYHISGELDSGNDVVLKDADGNNLDCTHINIDTDGTIKHRNAKSADNEAQANYYVKGGWHRVSAHKFFAADTDSSLGLRVKFEDA